MWEKIKLPKFFSRFRRPRSKKAKLASGAAVIVIALIVVLGWHRFGAFAQSVIDTFTDSSKVSATWNTFVDTTNHQVTLGQKTCNSGVWDCTDNNLCADTMGDGTYIIVAKADAGAAGTYAWKSTATNCDTPQCSQDGAQSGDELLPDNTTDFSNYPARAYCQSIGGRLPSITEMTCIFQNRSHFNIANTESYWAADEATTTTAKAYNSYYSDPGAQTCTKTQKTVCGGYAESSQVRCVFGW